LAYGFDAAQCPAPRVSKHLASCMAPVPNEESASVNYGHRCPKQPADAPGAQPGRCQSQGDELRCCVTQHHSGAGPLERDARSGLARASRTDLRHIRRVCTTGFSRMPEENVAEATEVSVTLAPQPLRMVPVLERLFPVWPQYQS